VNETARSVRNLAWVTCRPARGRDADEPLALAALADNDVDVAVVDWDDPEVDWSEFDRVVVRSAWDYPERLDQFTAWLERVDASSELVNPRPVMTWSMDKHYLAELDAAGIAITRSTFVEVGDRPRFPESEHGFVIKPAVGAGSRDVVRYPDTADARDAAERHIDRLHAGGRSVVVQPTLTNVGRHGEWPLMFLDGKFSHAAHRRVGLAPDGATDDLSAPERSHPATPTSAMLSLAERTLAHVDAAVGRTAYARIDLVLDDDGQPVVMEVELVEPSLFLPEHPPAAGVLARALSASITH
jgi:glutathione synthase/RimK-type ligase-like ATP-grasp enzyme